MVPSRRRISIKRLPPSAVFFHGRDALESVRKLAVRHWSSVCCLEIKTRRERFQGPNNTLQT